MFTGSARRIRHLRKPGLKFLNSLGEMLLNSPDFANFPKSLNAALNARPINEIVGGPPMKTLVGMARLKTVGSTMVLVPPFFFGRNGLIIPATWQANTGSAM